MSRASVADMLALDDLLASLPDMKREQIERALDEKTNGPTRLAVDEAYSVGFEDGRRRERAIAKTDTDSKGKKAG